MTNALSWFLIAASLTAGWLLVAWSVRELAAAQEIARRFRSMILPASGLPRMDRYGLVRLLGRKASDAAPELYSLLGRAGFPEPEALLIFCGVRLTATLAAVLAVPASSLARHGSAGPGQAALAVLSGFFVYRSFTAVLALRAGARQREIRRELPHVLDLVLMVVESGVSIDQTLHHVAVQAGRIAPLSAQALKRYLADTEDGVPFDKALDRLAQRLAIDEGRDFAGLLKQNLYQGGELVPPLRRLASDIGETRLAHARMQIARKTVLLTLAMLAFFMPVLMIALAGPAVSDLMGTLGNVAADLHRGRMKP
ncbi:MAG TPA: type II secretion system F family protein [Rhizomicrobium sp.]|nr:type II secretion system F family protein [Rhizomicrobium sp.]